MSGYYENVDGHRRFVQGAPTEDAPAAPDSDQQALPGALADFLRLPDVLVRADERACQIVIGFPSYLGRALAAIHPNPMQVLLATALVDAAEQDAAELRRDLLVEDRA